MREAPSYDAERLARWIHHAATCGWLPRPARSKEEYLEAFRLVHEAYEQASLDLTDFDGVRVTPWQLSDQATVHIVTNEEGRLLATATFVEDGPDGLPCDVIYGDVVSLWRRTGRLAEVTCLASARTREAFPALLSLMVFYLALCKRRGAATLLIAVHPSHARWYIRQFGFRAGNGLRSYAAVNHRPAVLLALDVGQAPRLRAELYQAIDWDIFSPEHFDTHPVPGSLRDYFRRFL